MKAFEIIYDDVERFGYKFSESYEKWISETVSKNGSKVIFKEKSLVIESPNQTKLLMSVMFIGYAFGQQDNGR